MITHNPRSGLFLYQLSLFRSKATKKRTIAPPKVVAQAATGPSFLLTKKGGKDVPKGVPPLGIPPLCRGCSVRYAHLRTAAQVTPHGTGAPLTLRNVPAGWSHKLSAGHRDILGRILLRGAGVPFATLTFTQRRPTTPSLSLFAKFSPVIEVAKFFKSAASDRCQP